MVAAPTGESDLDYDAEQAPPDRRGYVVRDVEGVGAVQMRAPLPQALRNISSAFRAKLKAETREEHLIRFVTDHLPPEEVDRIMEGIYDGEMPSDALILVAQSVATLGTGRPTVRSSR